MDDKTDLGVPKTTTENKPGRMGWPDAWYHFGLALVMSGYGAALLTCGTAVALAWVIFGGMGSAEKLGAFEHISGWPFALFGWLMAAAAIIGAKKLLAFQRNTFDSELKRLREVKEEALETQQSLKLVNPDDK